MTSPQSPVSSPAELILARADAFRRCDFGFIYDSCHPESNFRCQFPDRDEYIRYGWANLGKEFRIVKCDILREEAEAGSARIIFALEFELHGVRQAYAELASLEDDGEGWRYRCGQKLTTDDFPVPVSQLDFRHFEEAPDKVIY